MKTIAVKIENNTNLCLNQFDVFGAYKNLLKEFNEQDGSLELQEGVRIYADEPYKDILEKSCKTPFKIQSFEFISDNPKQISSLITLHRGDANGNIFTRNNLPRPTQDEKKSVINEHFLIDGFTKISILKIYPNTTLTIQLIPRKKSKSFFSQLFKEFKNYLQ